MSSGYEESRLQSFEAGNEQIINVEALIQNLREACGKENCKCSLSDAADLLEASFIPSYMSDDSIFWLVGSIHMVWEAGLQSKDSIANTRALLANFKHVHSGSYLPVKYKEGARPTGLYLATIKDQLRDVQGRIRQAEASLASLENKDSTYANEHRNLIAVFKKLENTLVFCQKA